MVKFLDEHGINFFRIHFRSSAEIPQVSNNVTYLSSQHSFTLLIKMMAMTTPMPGGRRMTNLVSHQTNPHFLIMGKWMKGNDLI